MATLVLNGVCKRFDQIDAVKDLSFEIEPGVMLGFLGPNGAGKTTTIRMIMDIIIPDAGEIQILDQPNSIRVRDRVGYLPEERGVYRKMKVHEALAFFAELKGLRGRDYAGQIEYWLERFEIGAARDKKMEELSKGNQQKIQFLTAVLHRPDLIIMDEPFMGLDPINAQLIIDIMLEQKQRGASIIFSTHQMEQAEKLCDSIALINRGELVLQGSLTQVKRAFGRQNLIISFEGDAAFLDDCDLVTAHNNAGRQAEVTLREGVTSREFLQYALQHVGVSHFELAEPSLHEIFLTTVGAANQTNGRPT